MKLSLLFLLTLTFVMQANSSYSQKTKISLDLGDVTVEGVIDEIEANTEFKFIFNTKTVNLNRKVSIKIRKATVEQVLDLLFKEMDISYELDDRKILLKKRETKKLEDLIQSSAVPIKMQFQVSGTVLDQEGVPLPGASIVEKGTTNGTQTDFDGNFSIELENEDATLVVSYIGFANKEIAINGQTNLNVVLEEDAAGLDEVVVVGYGSQKKVNLTGAIESIDTGALVDRPIGNVSQVLQGLSPGLTISQNSSTGQPGGTVSFNVRGAGAPLVLVDNLPVDINQINPEDIENITIIKDASAAAIYGANAPFGVILITTKRGKKGKAQFNYSGTFTASSPATSPKTVNSLEFAEGLNEASFNITGQPFGVFSSEIIDRITQYQNGANIPSTVPDPSDPQKWAKRTMANANTHWFDEVVRDFALVQKHDVSVRGGDDNTTYYSSIGWFYNQGLLKYGNDSYNRYNIDAKIETKVTDWFKVGILTKYFTDKSDFPSDRFGLGRAVLWHDLLRRWPTDPVKNPNGSWGEMSGIQVDLEGGREIERKNTFWTKIEAEIEPIKDWKIYGDYGWNTINSQKTLQRNTQETLGPTGVLYPHYDTPAVSYFDRRNGFDRYWRYNLYSSYEKIISDHGFKLLVGHQREYGSIESLYGNVLNLITPQLPTISTGLGETYVTDSQRTHSTMSTFGRFNYNYKEKYLLEVNGNYQGTYKFARGKRFGFFPSASVGYRISEEDFWSGLESAVSNLKLRASYGELGNYNTGSLGSVAYLPNMGVNSQINWVADGGPVVGIFAPGLISPYLTWETVRTLDFGIDATLLDGRLNLTADYFRRRILDQIGPANPVPAVLGTGVPNLNNTESLNSGWELSIGWQDNYDNGLSYYIKGFVTDYKTVIEKYNVSDDPFVSGNFPGKRLGDIWGYTAHDLFQSDAEAQAHADQSQLGANWKAGDVKYLDINGDGEVTPGNNTLSNHGDLSIIGNREPRYIYSFQGGVNYKGFDFSFLFNGVGKSDIDFGQSENAYWGLNNDLWQIYGTQESWDFWTPENIDAKFPRPYLSSETFKNRFQSTRSLENGAYLRLKNAQIGFTLPSSVTDKINLKKVRLFFNGENLLTFTKMIDTFDPEGVVNGGFGRGKVYPLQKSFSLGFNVNF